MLLAYMFTSGQIKNKQESWHKTDDKIKESHVFCPQACAWGIAAIGSQALVCWGGQGGHKNWEIFENKNLHFIVYIYYIY